MNKLQIKLNRKGVSDLMKSKEMQTVLTSAASEIRQRCGEGFSQDVYIGRNRANAMVWAETPEAKQENLKNNTLLKAVRS